MPKRRPPSGSPPYALATRPGAEPTRVYAYSYADDGCHEPAIEDLEALVPLAADRSRKLWVDVQGLDDPRALGRIGEIFGVHPLALADAVNTPQRPKADVFGDQLVIVTQMVRHEPRKEPTVEQLTLVVGPGFVITFQELEYGDVLDPVRARLRAGHAALVGSGPDYLAYAIVDTVIDGYFPVLEIFGERLETLEREVVLHPTPERLGAIHRTKRELLTLRRHLWPQRDAVASIVRGDAELVGEPARLHFRDSYDHAVQLIDVLETYRELTSSLMDTYVSSVSHRLNEIIKVLTVISTIFIPLSFVAGIYGMNFEHMPELRQPWAYPAVLGAMFLAAIGMLAWFRRRGWIGRPRSRHAHQGPRANRRP